ncbi:MAG TPA: LacI family transcriptional regulator [Firmicutes bacterium]|nr:LacI family transcriptional regulator [Bacillota bacterium]
MTLCNGKENHKKTHPERFGGGDDSRPKSKRRITSFDVAKEAGVSRSTVSAVINKNTKVGISESTTQKVLSAAARLGYIPKLAARSISSHRSYAIGLISCWQSNSYMLTRPLRGMMQYLRQEEYSLTLCDLGSADMTKSAAIAVKYFLEGRIDGLIIILRTNAPEEEVASALDLLRRENMPLVLVNTAVEEPDIDEVNCDNLHAGYIATKHLISCGHRDIAFIYRRQNAENCSLAEEGRYRGYIKALEEAGIEPPEDYVVRLPDQEFDVKQGSDALHYLMNNDGARRRPSAVYTLNDTVALGVIYAAAKAGLHLPEDLAIVGNDDMEGSRLLCPALTSVAQPLQQMGEEAARLLKQRIEGTGPDHPVKLTLPCHLVIRESCGWSGQAEVEREEQS